MTPEEKIEALREDGRLHEDTVDNLVPLCQWCHRYMPEHDEREDALGWLLSGEECGSTRQFFTDNIDLGDRPRRDLRKLTDRAMARAYETYARERAHRRRGAA